MLHVCMRTLTSLGASYFHPKFSSQVCLCHIARSVCILRNHSFSCRWKSSIKEFQFSSNWSHVWMSFINLWNAWRATLFFICCLALRARCHEQSLWLAFGKTVLIALCIALSPSVTTETSDLLFIASWNACRSHVYASSVSTFNKPLPKTIV